MTCVFGGAAILAGTAWRRRCSTFLKAAIMPTLQPKHLPNLIAHKGSFSALERQYRGWGRLSPLEQAAEHAVLLAEDWEWTTYPVTCEVSDSGAENGAVSVQLSYTAPDSARGGTYRVIVREAPEDTLQFPSSCGKEVEPQPQYVVEHVEKLH